MKTEELGSDERRRLLPPYLVRRVEGICVRCDLDPDVVGRIPWSRRLVRWARGAGVAALVGFVFAWAFGHGYGGPWSPDADILLLGIGWHRHFLFHGPAQAILAWMMWRRCQQGLVSSAFFSGYLLGTAVHLAVDGTVEAGKAVLFYPLMGSIVPGMLLDDRLWLAASSLFTAGMAVRIARPVIEVVAAALRRAVLAGRRLAWTIRLQVQAQVHVRIERGRMRRHR